MVLSENSDYTDCNDAHNTNWKGAEFRRYTQNRKDEIWIEPRKNSHSNGWDARMKEGGLPNWKLPKTKKTKKLTPKARNLCTADDTDLLKLPQNEVNLFTRDRPPPPRNLYRVKRRRYLWRNNRKSGLNHYIRFCFVSHTSGSIYNCIDWSLVKRLRINQRWGVCGWWWIRWKRWRAVESHGLIVCGWWVQFEVSCWLHTWAHRRWFTEASELPAIYKDEGTWLMHS